ncbi:MAG: bestrophin family ion channel [Flavobacteriaceae bacterium]
MILNKRIPLKYWLGLIKWDLIIVTVFSFIIFYVQDYLILIKIPITIGGFLGTAIALLLSFKLAQSYERWWEARKIWGAIVNDSRTLVLQVKHFMAPENIAVAETIGNRQIAWCYAACNHLRKQDTHKVVRSYVSEMEWEGIQHKPHMPIALLDLHSGDIAALHKSGEFNDFQHVQIDNTLVRLTASLGKAERIKNTVFPTTYRAILHFFIYIFLIVLSIPLAELLEFAEIPLLIGIALPFFLLEKIAFTIQDPFDNQPTDTAMTDISQNIEKNIRQLLDEDIPEYETKSTYYIL